MSSRGARRAPAAVRTRALCVVLLLLLQHAWCRLPCPAAADPVFLIGLKRYLTFTNDIFATYPGGVPTYYNSADVCRQQSTYLMSDQNDASHEATFEILKLHPNEVDLGVGSYMGADLTYSMSLTDERHCNDRAVFATLNCIYRWNLGGFLLTGNPEFDPNGVPFYKGSHTGIKGRGPMNGYKEYWQKDYPLMSRSHMGTSFGINQIVKAVWLDLFPDGDYNTDLTHDIVLVICEVQRATDTETWTLSLTLSATPSETETLPTPTSTISLEPQLLRANSWARQYWWAVLLIALLIILLALLVLCILFCIRRRKRVVLLDSDSEPPLELQDESLFLDENGSFKASKVSEYESAGDAQSALPLEGDAERLGEQALSAETDRVELMPLVPNANAAPDEPPAQTQEAGKPTARSARQRPQGKGSAFSTMFSDVAVPEGEEVMEKETTNVRGSVF